MVAESFWSVSFSVFILNVKNEGLDGGYSNMKVVYMCRTGFENGGRGLGSDPLIENWGGGCFQSGHSREKQGILELKITKKDTCIFFLNEGFFDLPRSEKRNKELYIFERGSFGTARVKKSRVFRNGQGRKMGGGGFSAAHTCTVLIWE